MRSLYVMRHGKASQTSPPGGDHERPLKPHGRETARRMGSFLTANDESPHLVLCSTAERARCTAEQALEAGAWDVALQLEPVLYEASVAMVVDLIRGIDAVHERVLIVGHQPTAGILIGDLTAGGPPHFSTTALARIDFAIEDWNDLGKGAGKLKWLVTPETLEQR